MVLHFISWREIELTRFFVNRTTDRLRMSQPTDCFQHNRSVGGITIDRLWQLYQNH